MKPFYAVLGTTLLMLTGTVALADSHMATIQTAVPLNKVTYQIVDEDWASSQTAKVTVAMDASLNQTKLDRIHQDLQAKLNNIAANANWHITTFQRVKNDSGLEQIHAEAQVRLSTTHLSSLRVNAKNVSTPGEKFTVQSIDYSPSTVDIQTVHANLRSRIYQQAKTELANLNKLYPKQPPYYLHKIDFNTVSTTPAPQMMMATATRNRATSDTDSDLPTSKQITETATVVLASQPDKAAPHTNALDSKVR